MNFYFNVMVFSWWLVISLSQITLKYINNQRSVNLRSWTPVLKFVNYLSEILNSVYSSDKVVIAVIVQRFRNVAIFSAWLSYPNWDVRTEPRGIYTDTWSSIYTKSSQLFHRILPGIYDKGNGDTCVFPQRISSVSTLTLLRKIEQHEWRAETATWKLMDVWQHKHCPGNGFP